MVQAQHCPPTLPLPHTPLQESMGPEQNQNWAEPLWQSQSTRWGCFLALGSSKPWWFMAELRMGEWAARRWLARRGLKVRADDHGVRGGFKPDLHPHLGNNYTVVPPSLPLVSDVTSFSERSLGNQAWLEGYFCFLFVFSAFLPICPASPPGFTELAREGNQRPH